MKKIQQALKCPLFLAAALTSAAQVADTGPVQYLALPLHPRPQADGNGEPHEYNANGIYRRGGHYIWNAPLVNGMPPGMTLDEAPVVPADPAPLADFSGGAGGQFVEGQVSSDGAPYHGETAAAATSTEIIGGSNRIYPGGCAANPCGVVAYEWDGNGFRTVGLPMTWKGTTFGITFDPSIDYDKNGNFYYALGGAPLSGNYPNSIAVSKRNAGVLGGWGTPVAVTYNRSKSFDDKYWIAVDRSSSAFANRIYVAWDRNSANNQILYLAYSSNGGATWTSPIKVDDGKTQFERVIGAYPAVDHRDGTVYVAWHNYSQNKIFVDRSLNGGVTWGTDVAAATTHTGFGMDLGCVGGRRQSPAHHLKVGPSGTLHLVYADNVSDRGFDILYVKSSDRGRNWSVPVTLNDDLGSAHQFHPALSVSANPNFPDQDIVSVSFYDRREDVNNCETTVYSTRSVNSGTSWSTNVRISTVSYNFDGNSNGPGDYSSSAPTGVDGDITFYSAHPPGPGTFEVNASHVQ